jgi:hypothetical protein
MNDKVTPPDLELDRLELEIVEIKRQTNDQKISSLAEDFKRLDRKCDLILEKIKRKKQINKSS